MKQIVFTIDPEEFKKELISGVAKEIIKISGSNTNDENHLITRKEACEYLRIASSTLWKLTKEKKLKAYYIGNRVFYKKNEVEDSLMTSLG